MKRILLRIALFTIPLIPFVTQTTRGQDIGPGEKGATLRYPGMEAPKAQTIRSEVPTPSSGNPPVQTPIKAGPRIAVPPSNDVSVNRDIEITDKHSPWVIYAMSYSGPDAPQFAREFAIEMRSNPKFRLNAFVFNYGAEEKRQEYERVQKLRQQQNEALEKAGIAGTIMPLRVRTVKVEEQTAVLIDGGFKTRDEALAALMKLRKIKLSKEEAEEFEKRVKLDMKVAILEQGDKSAKNGVKIGAVELVKINPFTRAFPARNPACKNDDIPQLDPEEAKLLAKLNKDEPLTVLHTKKPLTLAIKQYNTQQVIVRDKGEQKKFLDRYSFASTFLKEHSKEKEWTDVAATNAHNLAEAFRKSGLAQTYVLHAKYCSFVTVGGYDRPDDQELVRMQNLLESRFQLEGYRPYDLLPRPQVMVVPR